MRILLVVLNAQLTGGLETYSRDVAASLRRLGHEVAVLSLHERPQAFPGWGDVPVRALAPRNPLLFRLYFRVRHWIAAWRLRRSRAMYDRVFVMHPYAAAAARRAGVRYWVWTYGIEVWGAWPPQLEAGLRGAARVLAISAHTAQAVQRRLPGAQVDVVRPVVDTARFAPARPPRQPTPPFRLLTVGRLAADERYKGHEMVIRNLDAITRRVGAPVAYWIAGDGDDRPRLERAAQRHGVADKVRFLGRVPDDQLAATYQACDVFVMPSVAAQRPDGSWMGEGFGIVYLEASACGKPVVGSDTGGGVDAVEDGVTGFCIDPTSDAALVGAVARLLLEPGLARRMGEAGRQRVAAHFAHAALDRRMAALIGDDPCAASPASSA
ncbi:MAG: glycosyltransferase family 4 protein [Anaerolineae bacterium]|nr:glycosyltransferase family 4 protein [Anaerolineae bacterium]